MKTLALILFFTISNIALGGHDKGNGGCPTCQEFYNDGLEAAAKLIDQQSRVLKLVPLLNKEDIINLYKKIAMHRKVLPATLEELNGRTAFSYPERNLTYIVPNEYQKLKHSQKLILQIHELLVLARIEVDGVYTYTNRIKQIFPNYERLETLAKRYECMKSYCLITRPKYDAGRRLYDGKILVDYLSPKSNAKAVCAYFNLRKGGEIKVIERVRLLRSSIYQMDVDQAATPRNSSSIIGTKIIEVLKCNL